MRIGVINKKWQIIVRTDAWMQREFPKTHAVAVLEDRKIYIRRSSLNTETIIHELIHAYQHELSFYELQLDDDQISEWYAELFAKYGRAVLDVSNKLIAKLGV